MGWFRKNDKPTDPNQQPVTREELRRARKLQRSLGRNPSQKDLMDLVQCQAPGREGLRCVPSKEQVRHPTGKMVNYCIHCHYYM